MRLIRSYNAMFAFTSLGAKVDNSINTGDGPYVFKINGMAYHRLGSLVPSPGRNPRFAQLYVHDTANEVRNRINVFGFVGEKRAGADPCIVDELRVMLNVHNKLVKKFREAGLRLQSPDCPELAVRIVGSSSSDPKVYSPPTSSELAALIVGDLSVDRCKFDIVAQSVDGPLRRISSLHPALMALQYPLLFPYGEKGFYLGIKLVSANGQPVTGKTDVTMLEYYCYYCHYRNNQPNPYTCAGRLSEQIKVDCYSNIEDQGSTSNVHARAHQVLIDLKDAMPQFQAGDLRTYAMQPLPFMLHPTAPTQSMPAFVPGVDLTIYIPRQVILQYICAVLGLPINSVHTLAVGDGSFEGYINVGVPPDGTSSWTSAVPMIFNGAHMPTEYTAVDSAADSVITYLCTQKNIKIEDINATAKKQLEECYRVWVAYYQNIAQKAQQQTSTLWLRYNDLLGMIKYICIQSAGFLPIFRRRRRTRAGRVTVTPIYGGDYHPYWRPHKLARSLTGLLRHRRDTEMILQHQVHM